MFLFQQKVLNTEECCGESEHQLVPRKGNFLYSHHHPPVYGLTLIWLGVNSILNALNAVTNNCHMLMVTCSLFLARQHAGMLLPHHLLSGRCDERLAAKQRSRLLHTTDGRRGESHGGGFRLGGGACSGGGWLPGRGLCEISSLIIYSSTSRAMFCNCTWH